MQEITWHGLLAVGCSLTLMVHKAYKHIIIICEWYIMEFQFGDFGGTPAMFVQAVSTQEPFSGKESLRCTTVENVLIWVSVVYFNLRRN